MQISLIVPVYNKENYIEHCLDSILCQTFSDLEVILVDDGSTDQSGAICERYASEQEGKNDPENIVIRVIHKENGGLVSAWKRGLENATGQYVSFVDCDDWIDKDFCEKLVSHATGRDDEIIMSDYVIERGGGSQTFVYQNIEPGEYTQDRIRGEIFTRLFGLEDRAICRSRCMKLFSTKLAKNNMRYGDEKLRFGEDTSLTIPCVLDAGRIFICDHYAGYHYRFVTDSMVHDYDRNMMASIELVKKVTEQAITDKFGSDEARKKELIGMADKEYVYLLMYAVKNAAKADKASYIGEIQKICLDPDNRRIIENNPVSVTHKANKIIYSCLKNPNGFNCRVLRTALELSSKLAK